MNHQEMSYEESLSAADELIELMRENELELNSILEPLLFPAGPPPALTVAEIMRAQARMLARSAQSMAEADIAYNAALQKTRPAAPRPTSLISQDVAHKLALSAELENLASSMAEEVEAKVAPKLFPDGVPPDMTLLGFLQSLRECIEKERARLPESLDARGDVRGEESDDGDGSDGEQALAAWHNTINPIAAIYRGFCEQARLYELAEQIRMVECRGAARDSASRVVETA